MRSTFAAVLVALLLAGCKGESRPPMYHSKGQVVYKDSKKPVPDVGILFESTTPPYLRSTGKTDKEGRFNLSTFVQDGGAMKGEHRVCFGPAIDYGDSNAFLRIVPVKYHAFQTLGIVLNVQPNHNNDFTIEIDRP